ncbi:DNA topoisomerase 1 [Rickettsiales bacterium]|nr:DNA topoisomerase 1 [Rickettsiales bacterium]
MALVVVESPAKAKTISKYLGKDFKILSSFGHVRELPSRDGSVEPDKDFDMHYQLTAQAEKHLNKILDAAKSEHEIYLAMDPDREGEAIAWHLVEALRAGEAIRKNTKINRIVFNEITKKSVQNAVKNPRQIDTSLVKAQRARQALDYLVGFNLSPLLWRKLRGSRSAGRVQSVALRLICEREDEISIFIPREYWNIDLILKDGADKFSAALVYMNGKKLEKFDIANREAADEIVSKLSEYKSFTVKDITEKQIKRNPHPPFITSTLQQEAFRKLNFSAGRTMRIAQDLYEGIDIGGSVTGLITYMRTDGLHVAQEALEGIRGFIDNEFGDRYLPSKPNIFKTKVKNAQEAHEAIRPTDVGLTPNNLAKYLDKDQLKLYELIWRRMVASQMTKALIKQLSVQFSSPDDLFQLKTTGSTVEFDGFYKVYKAHKDEAEKENKLPQLSVGSMHEVDEIVPSQHFTQPSPRYTEASLIKTLEELGIGRPSTYAPIISVLKDRKYVRVANRHFVPEDRGKITTAFLVNFCSRYLEYGFTADLEQKLDAISNSETDWKVVLQDFWREFILNVDQVSEHKIEYVLDLLSDKMAPYIFSLDKETKQPMRTCPECKKGELKLRIGKFGPFIGCASYPECKYVKQGLGVASDDDLKLPMNLGDHPETGASIMLKKGPYGFYLEVNKDGDLSRVSIPKFINVDDICLELALNILSLPKTLGSHPKTAEPIKAAIGNYGPYLICGPQSVKIGKDIDVFSITLSEALEIISKAKPNSNSTKALAKLGRDNSGAELNIYQSSSGLKYIKYKNKKFNLDKDADYRSVTLEQALDMVKAPLKKRQTK